MSKFERYRVAKSTQLISYSRLQVVSTSYFTEISLSEYYVSRIPNKTRTSIYIMNKREI